MEFSNTPDALGKSTGPVEPFDLFKFRSAFTANPQIRTDSNETSNSFEMASIESGLSRKDPPYQSLLKSL